MATLTLPIPAPEHPGTVLVVGEPLALSAFTHLLERFPYVIVPCLTPHQAIRHVIDGNVRVVVCTIPKIFGVDFVRAIRQHDPDLPVVLVTDQPSLLSAAEAIEHGAFMCLVKPVRPETFVSAIERAARMYCLAKTKRQAIALFGDGAVEAEQEGVDRPRSI